MKHRQLMADLYHLLEEHETPIKDLEYWISLIDNCNELSSKYADNLLALKLINAIYNGLEDTYRVSNL